MHLSEQQRANALLLAESAAERLVKHAPRFVGEGFSLSEAHLDAVCVQQYILETKKLFDRIASLEGDLRKAAGAPQPGVPEGWSFVREGDRIRVISPGYATVDVLYNTRSQSEMMLYELVDAMLKAQPAEQPTFTVGTDLSDGELTVVVMKHESGVTRRIHEEVFEAVPVSILGSPERIRAGVDELSKRNRAGAAQMADMVVGGAVATEQHPDTFSGDNDALIRSARSLLNLDARGALVPHGIGTCARDIITAFIARMESQPAPTVQGEPVAWMHDSPGRMDVIHAAVKKLLADSHDAAGHLHRPLDKSQHYTIPLYAAPQPAEQQPAPDVAVPTPEMIEAGANAVMITDSASECAEKVYRAMRAAAPQPAPGSFDFLAHLRRQREWSERTFGPGQSTARIIDHITKELREVAAAPDDVTEWIDVAILALDGAWRCGASPEQIQAALVAKHKKNEARQWPDWRTMPADKAIEHSHTGEASTACCGDPGDCWEPCGDLGKSEAHVRVHSPNTAKMVADMQPIETIQYWAAAYADHNSSDHFRGHGMVVTMLREYAALRTALAAPPAPSAVPEGYVAIGESNLVTRREYGETADEASEKMERTGFYTYEIKELYASQSAPQPAEQWSVPEETIQYLAGHLNEINKAEDGDRDHDLERHLDCVLQALSKAPQPAEQQPAPDVAVPVEALEEISDPIRFMKERLEEGEQLNGMAAIQLAEDASYLRGIARAALATYRKGGDQ